MNKAFPNITTSRLLLRRFNPDDLDNVYRGLSHPEVIRYYGVNFQTLDDTKVQLQWFEQLEEEGTGLWWAICAKDSGSFQGAVGLYYLSQQHRKGEIGFWLLPEYWGQGVVREAIPPVLHYGFHELNLHRIEAFVEHDNENSKHSLEKLNFAHEGTMRDCEIKNGHFISLDIYARLAPTAI